MATNPLGNFESLMTNLTFFRWYKAGNGASGDKETCLLEIYLSVEIKNEFKESL